MPSASYSSEELPSLDFSFDVFAVAYAEVWVRPASISLDGYEFTLPWIKDEKGVPLLKKPRFLGYCHLILRPEDLGSHVFWGTIPLILLNGLLNGEEKPDGHRIVAATGDAITYTVEGFEEEVEVPNSFAEYLKSAGSIDKMIDMGVMSEKVGRVVKAAVDELEAKRRIPSATRKAVRRDSIKERAFRLFDEGKRPSDPEVKALGIKPSTAYRYYQEWKKLAVAEKP